MLFRLQRSSHPRARLRVTTLVAAISLAAPFAGCSRNDPAAAASSARVAPRGLWIDATALLRPEPVGAPAQGEPWIGHLLAVDLDRDGRMDALACESRESRLLWLRQRADGGFDERELAADLRAPVHADAVDFDGDGDLDILVASMGAVFPNNDRIGSLFILENTGGENFTPHLVLENVARVTDVRAADLNGDGRLDLAVAQFGYDQGEIRWMEQTGPWQFISHDLLALSGTINVAIADFDGNRTPDIVALVSQQWEEVHLFLNSGNGVFTNKVIFGSTNEDFACSGLTLCDLNRDGRPDILFSNGDGFGPTPVPGPRPWHGVQWLENNGGGFFTHRRIGHLPGAYSPVAVDLDQDGHVDVVAVSAFNDWQRTTPPPVSLVWFRHDGRSGFTPHVLAHAPTHLLTIVAADFGDGRPALLSGAFHSYPPYDRLSRLTLWRPTATAPRK